jgi:hypothetical protein
MVLQESLRRVLCKERVACGLFGDGGRRRFLQCPAAAMGRHVCVCTCALQWLAG